MPIFVFLKLKGSLAYAKTRKSSENVKTGWLCAQCNGDRVQI